MKEIDQLIEDYQRRSDSVVEQLRMLDVDDKSITANRLSVKLFCFKTFLVELKRLKQEICV